MKQTAILLLALCSALTFSSCSDKDDAPVQVEFVPVEQAELIGNRFQTAEPIVYDALWRFAFYFKDDRQVEFIFGIKPNNGVSTLGRDFSNTFLGQWEKEGYEFEGFVLNYTFDPETGSITMRGNVHAVDILTDGKGNYEALIDLSILYMLFGQPVVEGLEPVRVPLIVEKDAEPLVDIDAEPIVDIDAEPTVDIDDIEM